MKIVIATGIFEPESGGPATYTPKIASKLSESGHAVTVITYSDSDRYDFDGQYNFDLVRVVRGNRILNRLRFLRAVWKHAKGANVIYTLDWFAAGLPVSIVSLLSRVSYVVRVGGDYVWEQWYTETAASPCTLVEFYERGIYKQLRYLPAYYMIRFVLQRAAVVIFNSERQRNLYVKYFSLDPALTEIIFNPVPRLETSAIQRGKATKEFVFWGRFAALKNIESLVRAFALAQLPSEYTLRLIGDGPRRGAIEKLVRDLNIQDRVRLQPRMRLLEVLENVKDCRAFILPSWTDISPNQVYEAFSIGLPTVVTRENYLNFRDQLPIMVDPGSVEDISRALENLTDDAKYSDFSRRFLAITFNQSWDDALQSHLAVFDKTMRP